MAVTIRVVGDLLRFAQPDTVEIGGECSLGVAIDELIRRNPRLGEELFDAQGRMRHSFVLALDGSRAQWPEERERLIPDGGELLVTRFYGGG